MFDLFRRRDQVMRYVLTILLGLVALSMVITLIPGYGTPSAASDNVLAEVAGEPITMQEVQAVMRNVTKNRELPPEMMQMYVPQVLDQMVTERAIAYQAKKLGFEVSDQELATAIRSIISQYLPGGQFDRAVYRRLIESQQGISVEAFESNLRKNLLLLRLQNLALEGVVVPPQEIRDEYHRRNDKVKLQYVVYDPAALRAGINASPEELRAYYEKNKANFKTPERRGFHLLVADEGKMGESVAVSDADLQRAYQANQDRYRSPERVRVRHILIKTMERPKEEAGKLEAKAADLLKQLRAGADFAELAKKHSEDTGSAVKGGDLDWLVRGQTVAEFEKAAFSLPVGQLSNLIKTQYGFHILQVQEKEAGRVKPFAEVKDELTRELRRRTVYERMQSGIEQARIEIIRNPQQAQQVADKYGLVYARVEKHGPGESIPELGSSPEIDASIQSIRPGEATPVVQVGPSRLAVAVLTNIEAPRQAEFAEVESRIRAVVVNNKAQIQLQQKKAQVTEAMKQGGTNLEAIAATVGGELKTTDFVTVNDQIGNIGAATMFSELFAKPAGSVAGPFSMADYVILGKSIDKQVADEAGLAAVREEIMQSLKMRRARERKDLFEAGLVTQLTKDGKIKKYPEAIRRLSSAFRG